MFKKKKFNIKKFIDNGSYGKIYQINYKNNLLCLKKIKKKTIVENQKYSNYSIEDIKKNLKIILNFNHKNLIKCYRFEENEKNFYLIMELLHYNYIKYDNFSFKVTLSTYENKKKYIKELISGIQYLHSRNLCHFDLSPNNIMLDKNKTLKIIDLDNMIDSNRSDCTDLITSFIIYPPEILNKDYKTTEKRNFARDIWAIGVLTYMILIEELHIKARKYKILVLLNEYNFIPNKKLSEKENNILKKMLNNNPDERISINRLIIDEYFN